MPGSHLNPAAQRTASTMLATYRVDAIAVAEREVAARIAANEVERALHMDLQNDPAYVASAFSGEASRSSVSHLEMPRAGWLARSA
jgi:hypothetical protein